MPWTGVRPRTADRKTRVRNPIQRGCGGIAVKPSLSIAPQIQSQAAPVAKAFEVQSKVCRLGAAYMLMHLAGCLRFWYLEVWCEYSMPSMPSMIWYFIFPASAESFGSF